jgi:hypothetical protein
VTRPTTPLPITNRTSPSGEEDKNQTTQSKSGFSIKGQRTGDGGEATDTNSVPVGMKSVPGIPAPMVPAPLAPLTEVPTRPTTSTLATSQAPAPSSQPSPLSAPKLADVRLEDLKDTGRLLDLHHQAVEQGVIGESEADRLRFLAAAEHALAIGKANPCGLFVYLIRGKLWRYLTQSDENRANARIKAHLRGPALPTKASGMGCPSIRPVLSDDAQMVLNIRAALAKAKFKGDPFPQLRRIDASWDRARWDDALRELG